MPWRKSKVREMGNAEEGVGGGQGKLNEVTFEQ